MPEVQDIFPIFNAMPIPAVVVAPDPAFTIAEVNALFLKNSGRSRDELAGKGLFAMFSGQGNDFLDAGIQTFTQSFNTVIRTGKPDRMAVYRYDLPGPAGATEERYWRPENIPILDSAGKVRFILHAVTDITAEVKLHEVHRKNRMEYESLFEQHPDMVFSLDLDGYFTRVNQAAVQLSGRSEGELLSMHFTELSLPEEAGRLETYFSECCAGAAFNVEVPAVGADGKRHELHISIMPLVIDGQVQGVYGIAKDETEKYRFQQERQLISRISQIFNCGEELSGCLSEVLKALCEYTGAKAAEAWIGNIDHTEIIRAAGVGPAGELRHGGKVSFNQADGLIGRAWYAKAVVQMVDLPNNPDYIRLSHARDHQLLSGVAVPIVSGDQVVAVLAFFSDQPIPIPGDRVPAGLLDHLAGEIRRKKAEQELNRFFNLSPDMLAIVGFDGYFKKTNAMFTQLLGYTAKSSPPGRYLISFTRRTGQRAGKHSGSSAPFRRVLLRIAIWQKTAPFAGFPGRLMFRRKTACCMR